MKPIPIFTQQERRMVLARAAKPHITARPDIEISLIGTPGYSTTGGPWIDPERGMKKVVLSITETVGGKALSLALPAIGGGALGRDIAVLAVPLKANLSVRDVVDVSGRMRVNGKDASVLWYPQPSRPARPPASMPRCPPCSLTNIHRPSHTLSCT
jgi:hypothetical protein